MKKVYLIRLIQIILWCAFGWLCFYLVNHLGYLLGLYMCVPFVALSWMGSMKLNATIIKGRAINES